MVRPKAILFDIGGVVVVSPFQAIVDYEQKNSIPKDWINFSISRSAPNGAWQRLERGEIQLDEEFFSQFRQDLHRPQLWESYHGTFKGRKKTLKQLASANPTMLGDPISLKAETSDTDPTPETKGAQSDEPGGHKLLKELADPISNPTALGDPVSLKAEKTKGDGPMHDDSGALPIREPATSSSSPSGSTDGRPGHKPLKELANTSHIGDPTSLKADSSPTNPTPAEQGSTSPGSGPTNPPSSRSPSQASTVPSPSNASSASSTLPLLPRIDSTALFWAMMSGSRALDPHMFPALQALRASSRYIIGALSNTVTFPADHPFSQDRESLFTIATNPSSSSSSRQNIFDVFVGSSDVRLRKPDRQIYELAVDRLDHFDRGRGGEGVKADQVVFLDDIGANCKAARAVGMGTIKVDLGRTREAVRELEAVTGLVLAGKGMSKL